ncbi:MAG: chloride channel protein [Clostridia bacterium]|nr:chloride channel protein [Clostridia bacterium]
MNNCNFKKTLLSILKLCVLGVLIGAVGGLVGGVFSRLLFSVTNLRMSASWIILLLPIGGIATVGLYRVFNMSDFGGTNEIIRCLKDNKPIKTATAPLIFISTAITHLFGGSAGREGAAIQLGGSMASSLCGCLRLIKTERSVFIMSGMSAVFAGVFGTPITATIFVLEFKFNKKVISMAVLPCFISAIISKTISSFIGVAEETVFLKNIPSFSLITVAKVLVLSLLLCVLGNVMCFLFHKAETFAKRIISNDFVRIALGSVVIIILTMLVGDMRYSGSGMNMAIDAINGNADWFDFVLKMVFTAITLAVGFKGGEIVPTFCIGATFGCVFASVLGLDVSLCAALGFIGLFCCATNSPFGAIFLGIEMFGFTALPYYIIVCLILLPLSAKNGLFQNRFFKSIIPFKKLS